MSSAVRARRGAGRGREQSAPSCETLRPSVHGILCANARTKHSRACCCPGYTRAGCVHGQTWCPGRPRRRYAAGISGGRACARAKPSGRVVNPTHAVCIHPACGALIYALVHLSTHATLTWQAPCSASLQWRRRRSSRARTVPTTAGRRKDPVCM